MKQRALRLVGAVGCLLSLPFPLHAQADPSGIWTATGGEARFELRADFLPDFGLEVVDDGLVVREVVEARPRLDVDDRLLLTAPHGNFERFVSGSITLDTGWLLRHRDRQVRLDGLTWTPGVRTHGHPSLEARDAAGRHLLTLTHVHIVADAERGLLTLHNADLVATPRLAELLGLAVLADRPIGMAWLDLELRAPNGADLDGRPVGCTAARPLWPQQGHEADIALIEIGDVVYQGTDGDGRIKVAPSAKLKNVGIADVPWIPKFQTLGDGFEYPYDPPDQHPFLVWNMYRIADGRIEQLGPSGVKHAFFAQNTNCDNCGSNNVLWQDCEDVYGSNTNNQGFNLGPRGDIEASLGLFFSTCSFFDPGCTGTQTNSSEEFENRLMIDPAELQTPDAEYFLDAWYVIQYDVDIWNSMGYHSLTPTPAGDGWDFDPLGPFTEGRVIDEWVDPDEPGSDADHAEVVIPSATPEEPYPGDMPQGHIRVLVRVTEPEPGRHRYNYAVQNFDFDRGVRAFGVPLPPGSEVFDTRFRDVDDDPGNDWSVDMGDDFVRFRAPPDNPLPWFTLFNFEVEVDAPPIPGRITLALSGDAVTPAVEVEILSPAVTTVPIPLFTEVGLEVDGTEIDSDANGILEPGETVEAAPIWENVGTGAAELTGTAEDLTGPPGATYTLSHKNVNYGTVAPGATGSCQDTGGCYRIEVSDPPVRPATLWEATFDETISDGSEKTWTLHIGDSFSDVPRSSLFYTAIETLLGSGVTGGCTGTTFCPTETVSRAQMAVLMLRALEGADYTPPACVEGNEVFDDVPFDDPFCSWIQELANREIVAGCTDDNYCPNRPVIRSHMAIFLLRTIEGPDYEPKGCTGQFTDVPCPSLFADWVEDLATRGITSGCTATEYCPHDAVTRAQMAVFVTRTFGLELYGP